MSCCPKKAIVDGEYVPLNARLVEYGKSSYGEVLMKRFPNTKVWIFSFFDGKKICPDCRDRFGIMAKWLNEYGFQEDPINNVKWIFENFEGADGKHVENMIWNEFGLTKMPLHIFCDSDGNIFNMYVGFPDEKWLVEYLRPYIVDHE